MYSLSPLMPKIWGSEGANWQEEWKNRPVNVKERICFFLPPPSPKLLARQIDIKLPLRTIPLLKCMYALYEKWYLIMCKITLRCESLCVFSCSVTSASLADPPVGFARVRWVCHQAELFPPELLSLKWPIEKFPLCLCTTEFYEVLSNLLIPFWSFGAIYFYPKTQLSKFAKENTGHYRKAILNEAVWRSLLGK